MELLADGGTAAATVRAVCATARLNPRYFYESFDDRDDLLVAIYNRVARELGERVAAAVSNAVDDDGAMRAAVETTVDFILEDPRRGRVLFSEGLDNEALTKRRVAAEHGLVELVGRDSAERPTGTPHPHLSRLGAAVLVGGFSELLVNWLDGRVDLDRDELVDATTELLVSVRDATRRIGERAPQPG